LGGGPDIIPSVRKRGGIPTKGLQTSGGTVHTFQGTDQCTSIYYGVGNKKHHFRAKPEMVLYKERFAQNLRKNTEGIIS